MKISGIIKHIVIIVAAVLILIGVPVVCSGGMQLLFDTDAVSAATQVIEQPSGHYVVLINADAHPDEEKLADWVTFFSGGEILYIFEDISVSVAAGDAEGMEHARSFQSRLPENQMKIYRDDAVLMLSRAEHGLYDMIIMSEEFADLFDASTVCGDSCVTVTG